MELLERERCLLDLMDWLEAAADRSGLVALVAGEAGIGKTSLITELSRRQRKVARVLWGACDSLFTPRPLAPLHDIARQTQKGLLAALAAGDRDTIFTAALDELERGGPALVVLEDLHWADEATLDLLKFLGRRIQRTRTLLVVTYRDDEVGPRHPLRIVTGELARANVRRMQVGPLSEVAVQKLASGAGRPAKGLREATGGNPFFVTEVLAADAESVPVTVKDAVLARSLRLTPGARELAELVSVVPGRAEAWLLEEAVRPDEAAIEGCVSIGMIRGEDNSLAFRHELARRALEDSLAPSRAVELHARVLQILSRRSGTSAARLAHHADGARNVAEVMRLAPEAAMQAAAVGAHREAASHLRMALKLAPKFAPEELARLHELLAYECYLTDQIEAAIEARLAALRIWQAAGNKMREGDTLRWLSRLSWFAGDGADADRYAAEAIAVLDPLPPGAELAMAYSNQAQLDMLAARTEGAIQWAQRTIALAEPAQYLEIVSHALNNLGTARLTKADAGGRADLERSLAIALAHGFQEHAARAYTNLGSTDVANRVYESGLRALNEGIAYCEARDLDSWRLYMLAWRARARLETGEWNLASEDAETVLHHSQTAPIIAIPALTVIGQLRVRRGDTDAGSPLEEARALAARTHEVQRIGPLASAFANAAWIEGDFARLVREVRPCYELSFGGRHPWISGELAVWLRRADALDAEPADIAEPYALELAGDWAAAAGQWASLGCPYERALVLAFNGGASEQLEALAVLERLGATAAANALRRQLRAQGTRGVPRGSRSSTRSHPQGLTRREAEVLALLSKGMRNSAIAKRLFLSTKTVDHHVSAILAKLSVPSRAEAVAMMKRAGDDGA